MIKHLVIQLDDTAVSFCHYSNNRVARNLINLSVLDSAILWAIKENVSVQILYPDYVLPTEYWEVLSKVYRTDIVSSTCEDTELRDNADVVVFDTWGSINYYPFSKNQIYLIRTTFCDLFTNGVILNTILPKVSRFNIVVTDTLNLTTDVEKQYSKFLENLSSIIIKEYRENHAVQINVLTDRMVLTSMNNCSAGVETITLAPNGLLYVCPGFYLEGDDSVGDLTSGILMPNSQLYKLEYAPICRICDAWHCKRCVWQNKKTTLEANTPSREQCVLSHIERNATRNLLSKIREIGSFMPGTEINELPYLDPFEKIISNREA